MVVCETNAIFRMRYNSTTYMGQHANMYLLGICFRRSLLEKVKEIVQFVLAEPPSRILDGNGDVDHFTITPLSRVSPIQVAMAFLDKANSKPIMNRRFF